MSNLVDNRYQLIEVIGAGGMATVWRAQDLRLNRTVALKRPRVATKVDASATPGELDASALQARMSREMQLAASLSHPNLVTVHDAGYDNDGLYLVMELVEAPSLASTLARLGRLDRATSLTIGAETADALTAVHQVGIVHRDVKPGNILVAATGAKLTDFGIATAESTNADVTSQTSLTQVGSVLGTLNYASPEVLAGESPSDRSDVFSLAAVVYEMLTGRLPFPDVGRMSVPPSVGDSELDAIFAEALAHDAWRRPSASAFADSLRSALAPTPVAKSQVSPPPLAGASPPPPVGVTPETAILPPPVPPKPSLTPPPPSQPSPVPVGSTQTLPPHLLPDRSAGPVVGRPLLAEPDQPAPPPSPPARQTGQGSGGAGPGWRSLVALAAVATAVFLAGYLVVQAFKTGDSVEATGPGNEQGDGSRVDAGEGDDITPQTLPSTTTTTTETTTTETTTVSADDEAVDGEQLDPFSRTLDDLEEALDRAEQEFDETDLPSDEVDDLLDQARDALDSARESDELETVQRLDDLRRRLDDVVGDDEDDNSVGGRLERLARMLGLSDGEQPAEGEESDDSGG